MGRIGTWERKPFSFGFSHSGVIFFPRREDETFIMITPRIVVIEDDEGLAELFRLNLERAGYTVQRFRDGKTAIQALRQEKADLLLLDHTLADMLSLDLLDRLRQDGILPPFLVISGSSDHELEREWFSRGARGFLLKDASLFSNLIPAVRHALSRSPSSPSRSLSPS